MFVLSNVRAECPNTDECQRRCAVNIDRSILVVEYNPFRAVASLAKPHSHRSIPVLLIWAQQNDYFNDAKHSQRMTRVEFCRLNQRNFTGSKVGLCVKCIQNRLTAKLYLRLQKKPHAHIISSSSSVRRLRMNNKSCGPFRYASSITYVSTRFVAARMCVCVSVCQHPQV